MTGTIWSPASLFALDRIIRYISEHNPAAAERAYRRIVDVGDGLHLFPRRYREVAPGLRHAPVLGLPYVIRYRLRRGHGGVETVVIVSVRHMARRPDF